MKYNTTVKKFSELSLLEWQECWKLRQEVFIVEQDCPYLDIDGLDESSIHFLTLSEQSQSLVAYARVFAPGFIYPEHASIGRVVVRKKLRNLGIGRAIMSETIDYCREHFPGSGIRISAQTYLESFYNSLGFIPTGERYLEDGIPHMAMVLDRK